MLVTSTLPLIKAGRLARRLVVRAALLGIVLVACKGEPARVPESAQSPGAPGAKESPAMAAQAAAAQAAADQPCADMKSLPWRLPAAERVVAIGDLHGDLGAAQRALRLAGAMDEHDRWTGGELVVVQTGDILDRGDDEQAIMDLFGRLRAQATEAGGAVHVLNGNHELMNAAGDFRYVTPGGFRDFDDAVDATGEDGAAGEVGEDGALARFPAEQRARVAALSPGGAYARVLANQNVAIVLGDTVFAHGGVTPGYAKRGLDAVNRDVRCWLLGGDASAPEAVNSPDGPVWSRHYSLDPPDCALLRDSLGVLGARRMVVGHTTHTGGINSACEEKVWRIDVGLAAHYGGPTQVLEIRGDQVRVLGE